MPRHLAGDACLHPRLLDHPARTGVPRRVLGLLRRADEPGAPRLIDAVEFDGTRCRFRTIDAHGRPDADAAGRWLDERPDDDYLPCSRLVVERLRTLGRGRTSASPEPATDEPAIDELVTDAVVTPDGRVRIALRDARRRSTRWVDA